jgi:hypothetical protein
VASCMCVNAPHRVGTSTDDLERVSRGRYRLHLPGAMAAGTSREVAPGAAGRVGLVGCVKTKLRHAVAAKDLYISPLFLGRRAYVERSCQRWLILSSLRGLIDPDEVIEPYEQTLKTASMAERRRWSHLVLQSLDERFGDVSHLSFEIHAGKDYIDYGLVEGLIRRGARVELPVQGLTMGEQLAFYAGARVSGVTSAGTTSSTTFEPRRESADQAAPESGGELDGASPSPSAAFDSLAFAPHLIRAGDWPADLVGLEHPGLYVWHVDAAGAE